MHLIKTYFTFRFLSVLLLLLVNLPALAQSYLIKGYIKDALSDERVPFASISFIKSGSGKLSDSAGTFAFRLSEWPQNDTLLVTYVGYKDYKFIFSADAQKRADSSKILEIIIGLDRGKTASEVLVKRKIDRGYLMWKRIVKHKPENDRYRFRNFSYELYNKLELDLNRINRDKMKEMGLLKPFGFIFDNVDTTQGAPFLPVYLTETISDFYYQKNPFKTREIIKGSKTEGVNNESVSRLLGGTDQNINLYANFIPVFDKQFIGPLSDNGDGYYKYRVLDTQIVNNQRLIHFSFAPKRKGENTFEGDAWAHDPTWAVQKITLYLSREANINFVDKLSLIQEYSQINDSTWFLTKDKFVVDIAPIGKTRFGVIGRKTSTYRNINYNLPSIEDTIKKNKILQEVLFAKGAREKADEFWNNKRHEDLSKNEKSVYAMIDTLQKMPIFRKYTNILNFVATGYLDVGNYQIGPWQNWIFNNQLEGLRLRWDLGTNRHFNKNLILHGYVAYGFKDKKFKYEGDAFYLFNRNPRTYLFVKYSKDIDYGQQYLDEVSQDNIFALAIRKKGVPIKFLFTEEKRIDLFKEWHSGFSVTLSANDKRYDPLLNLPGKDLFPGNGGETMNNFEASVKLRFAYMEKFLEGTFFRTSLGSPYPIAELKVSKGISNVLRSDYTYTKVSGGISDFLKIAPYGSVYFNVFAGKTTGTLPYMLLDVAPGNEIYYYNRYAYNLMNRWEYLHDEYAGFNVEHNVGNGLFRFIPLTRKLKFRQFYTFKGLWGSLTDANKAYNNKPGYNFLSLDGKTYLEIGTGVDNIFKVFRMDFVWRLAPRPLPIEKNKRFGAFFSFRLAF
jgi:Family of unknown function (DUF5686)/CarboxypepD_reg-like domain